METRVPMGTVKIESIGERDWLRVIGEDGSDAMAPIELDPDEARSIMKMFEDVSDLLSKYLVQRLDYSPVSVREEQYDGRIVLREYIRPAEYHRFAHVRPDGTEDYIGEYVTIKGQEAYPALCKTVREDWLQMGEGAARGKMQNINAEVVHDEGRC